MVGTPARLFKNGFPRQQYCTVTYRWACADWKQIHKTTYFWGDSRIKIRSLSQVNFLAYYESTNHEKYLRILKFKISFDTLPYDTAEMKNRRNG